MNYLLCNIPWWQKFYSFNKNRTLIRYYQNWVVGPTFRQNHFTSHVTSAKRCSKLQTYIELVVFRIRSCLYKIPIEPLKKGEVELNSYFITHLGTTYILAELDSEEVWKMKIEYRSPNSRKSEESLEFSEYGKFNQFKMDSDKPTFW